MVKLIQDNNKVSFGSIDSPLDWNYEQYRLFDIFGKEIRGRKKHWKYHQFNYIGLLSDDFVIGIATVDLSFAGNIFAFYSDLNKGIQYTYSKKLPGNAKKMNFSRNPDDFMIDFKNKNSELLIMKSHEKGKLELHCNFESSLIINATIPFDMENSPLRVLNPASPSRWMFTEKFPCLRPKEIDICLNGMPVPVSAGKTTGVYDWSGGYPLRDTSWFWACFGGNAADGSLVGANLASLVNQSFCTENAVWTDSRRRRLPSVFFDFDRQNPYKPWEIHDENRELLDLVFKPDHEHSEKLSAMPFAKIYFRQLIGRYSGWVLSQDGNKVPVDGIPGFAEVHRSIW